MGIGADRDENRDGRVDPVIGGTQKRVDNVGIHADQPASIQYRLLGRALGIDETVFNNRQGFVLESTVTGADGELLGIFVFFVECVASRLADRAQSCSLNNVGIQPDRRFGCEFRGRADDGVDVVIKNGNDERTRRVDAALLVAARLGRRTGLDIGQVDCFGHAVALNAVAKGFKEA